MGNHMLDEAFLRRGLVAIANAIFQVPAGNKRKWGTPQLLIDGILAEVKKLQDSRPKWIPASVEPQAPADLHPGHYIPFLAVVDDEHHRMNGDDPFVDIAAYWPEKRIWTVTGQCRSDQEPAVDDVPAQVSHYAPIPELPAFIKAADRDSRKSWIAETRKLSEIDFARGRFNCAGDYVLPRAAAEGADDQIAHLEAITDPSKIEEAFERDQEDDDRPRHHPV